MSFSDALGQLDQIIQWEQQLADPTAPAAASAASGSSATSQSTASDAASSSSFADVLAAAEADTEASATSTLTDPADTVADDSSDVSDLLGGGDSQLLSALASISSGGSTGSTGALDLADALPASATGTLDLADALPASATGTLDLDDAQPTSDSGPAGGEATSASDPRIQAMTEEANALVGKPYEWGGGHDGWGPSNGYDCSGFVSAVLHAGGYLSSPQDTATLPDAAGIESGPGNYVTIYDRDEPGEEGHVIIDIDGQFYESGGQHGSWGGGGGVEQISTPSESYLSSFNEVLHPAGL